MGKKKEKGMKSIKEGAELQFEIGQSGKFPLRGDVCTKT